MARSVRVTPPDNDAHPFGEQIFTYQMNRFVDPLEDLQRESEPQRASDTYSLFNNNGMESSVPEDSEHDEMEEIRRIKANRSPRINYDNPLVNSDRQSQYQAKVNRWNYRPVTQEELHFNEDRDVELSNPERVDDLVDKQITAFEQLKCSEANNVPGFNMIQSLEKNATEWTFEEEIIFEDSMFKFKKDFTQVQKNLPNKTVAECIQFYYTWKKDSPDAYAKLKKNLKGIYAQKENDQPLKQEMSKEGSVDYGFDENASEEICTMRKEIMQGLEINVKSLQNFFTTFNKLTKAVEEVTKTHSQLTIAYNNYDAQKTSNESKSMEDMEKLENMEGCLDEALQLFDMGVKETYKKLSKLPDPRRTTRKITKRMENVKEQLKQSGYMDDIGNHFMAFGKLPENFEGTPNAEEVIEAFQDCKVNATEEKDFKNRGSLDFFTEYSIEIEAGCHTGLVLFPFENKYSYTHIIDEVIEGSPLAEAVDVNFILNKEIVTVNRTFVKNINTQRVAQMIRDFCAVGGTLLLGVMHEPVSKRDRDISEENEFLRKELNKKTKMIEKYQKMEKEMQNVMDNLMIENVKSDRGSAYFEKKCDDDFHNYPTRDLRETPGLISVDYEVIPKTEEEKVSLNQEQEINVDEDEASSDQSVTGTEYSSSSDSDSDSGHKYDAIVARIIQADKDAADAQIANNFPREEPAKEEQIAIEQFIDNPKLDETSSEESAFEDEEESSTDEDSDDSESDSTTDNKDSEDDSSDTSDLNSESDSADKEDDQLDDKTEEDHMVTVTRTLTKEVQEKGKLKRICKENNMLVSILSEHPDVTDIAAEISTEHSSEPVTTLDNSNEALVYLRDLLRDEKRWNEMMRQFETDLTETETIGETTEPIVGLATEPVIEESATLELASIETVVIEKDTDITYNTDIVAAEPVGSVVTAPIETVVVEKTSEVVEQDDVAKKTETIATDAGFTLVEMLILLAVIVNIIVFCLL